jgi:hypothetical protein
VKSSVTEILHGGAVVRHVRGEQRADDAGFARADRHTSFGTMPNME